jgi:hypothetical protein
VVVLSNMERLWSMESNQCTSRNTIVISFAFSFIFIVTGAGKGC